jgi:hypothetical protein
VQRSDSSATSGNRDDRCAIILTWTQTKFRWGRGYLDAVEQTANGFGVVSVAGLLAIEQAGCLGATVCFCSAREPRAGGSSPTEPS